MEENQRNRMSEERLRSERNDESLNTSSQPGQMDREGKEQGSGRSYDYGTEGQGQQTGRQNVGSEGSSNMGNRSDHARESGSGMGQGSGLNTKRSVTGSDYDGQNSE